MNFFKLKLVYSFLKIILLSCDYKNLIYPIDQVVKSMSSSKIIWMIYWTPLPKITMIEKIMDFYLDEIINIHNFVQTFIYFD